MRQRRTLQGALALALVAAPAAMAAGAYAAEPLITPINPVTRCDLAAHSDPGVAIRVGMTGEDLGTGSQYGAALADGTVDDTWTVPAKSPDDAYAIKKHDAWIAPSPATKWINSRPDYNSTGTGVIDVGIDVGIEQQRSAAVDPLAELGTVELGPVVDQIGPVRDPVSPMLPTTTTFRARFEISQNSYLNRLNLSYAADNGVTFYLNGTVIGGFDPVGADTTAFKQMRPLAYAGPLLVDGINTLDAVVTDYGVATGLLVTGGYEGCLVRYAAGTCIDLREDRVYAYSPQHTPLDTGLHNGSRFPIGSIDSNWRTTSTTFGDVYSVAPYGTAWYSGSTRANWVHIAPNPEIGTGSYTSPRTYTYRIEFTMGSGATYRDLNLKWAADNAVTFSLNGTPIGTFSGTPTSHFNVLHPLVYTGPFNAGTNVLEAAVTDYGVATGLLVEGDARECHNRLMPS